MFNYIASCKIIIMPLWTGDVKIDWSVVIAVIAVVLIRANRR